MAESPVPVVIDNGSAVCKVGFAGAHAPTAIFPSIIGRPRHQNMLVGVGQNDSYVGDQVHAKHSILSVNCPIRYGIITNWEDMETIWHYAFDKALGVGSEDRPVLVTEAPLATKHNQESLVKVMFETFNVPALHLANQAMTALFASGRTTGIVLNSGNECTYAVPFHECKQLPEAALGLKLGGCGLTDNLCNMLKERGHGLVTTFDRQVVSDLKEKLCYVALHIGLETRTAGENGRCEKSYELPNGQIITVGTERFRCPEALFQPSLVDVDGDGVHELVSNSILKCNADIRKNLYSNIILSGGTTLLPGFEERIEKEVSTLAPKTVSVNIIAPPERKYLAWVGASILCTIPVFQRMWMTRQEYEEFGPTIVHRNFF